MARTKQSIRKAHIAKAPRSYFNCKHCETTLTLNDFNHYHQRQRHQQQQKQQQKSSSSSEGKISSEENLNNEENLNGYKPVEIFCELCWKQCEIGKSLQIAQTTTTITTITSGDVGTNSVSGFTTPVKTISPSGNVASVKIAVGDKRKRTSAQNHPTSVNDKIKKKLTFSSTATATATATGPATATATKTENETATASFVPPAFEIASNVEESEKQNKKLKL